MSGVRGASCDQITSGADGVQMDSHHTLAPFLSKNDQQQALVAQHAATQLASAGVALQSGLSWIFTLGIRPDMPFYVQKNLALINRVVFISLILALPGSFLLLLVGFDHSLSLLVSGTTALCLILVLNRARRVEWAQALFAFFPAVILMSYTLIELRSGGIDDLMVYILVRQGLCLSLLLPVILYGFQKVHRGIALGLVAVIFLVFDVTSQKWGQSLLESGFRMSPGLFSVLSLVQLTGLSGCVLYVQAYTLRHEQQVRLSNERLRHLAIRDGMTGLFNHTFMEQLIGDAINRSKRSGNPLSLLMIDVDGFKQINDRFGHNTGDQVLVHLTRLLQGSKRVTDYLGRWGGDELILLLTDTNLQGAGRLAEKLRDQVDSHIFPGPAHLTISLGASEYLEGDTLAGLIARADKNMYHAKHLGSNRVHILHDCETPSHF